MTDKDIFIKRAQFITKTVELNQEFYFASGTKLELNGIFNFHFMGGPLCEICLVKLQISWNALTM